MDSQLSLALGVSWLQVDRRVTWAQRAREALARGARVE